MQYRGSPFSVRRYAVLLQSDDRKQDEIQDEQNRRDPEDRMDLLRLLLADLDDAVGNEAERDAVGNAVAERHEEAGKEGWDRFGDVRPLDFLEGRGHHHADRHECRRRSRVGNRADERRKERADRKADGDDNAGEAGSDARRDAGSALDKGGRIGGAEDRAD